MPYVIAFVIIIVAAGALLLFREPVEAPVVEEVQEEQVEQTNGLPEGFFPPTENPPSTNPGGEAAIEIDEETVNVDITPEVTPEAVAAPTETYVAQASYFTPKRTEHDMVVTLEVEGETIVDANVTYDAGSAQTPSHIAFDNAYGAAVIGQNINTIELSRVGGASLTSTAFNDAVVEIRAQI